MDFFFPSLLLLAWINNKAIFARWVTAPWKDAFQKSNVFRYLSTEKLESCDRGNESQPQRSAEVRLTTGDPARRWFIASATRISGPARRARRRRERSQLVERQRAKRYWHKFFSPQESRDLYQSMERWLSWRKQGMVLESLIKKKRKLQADVVIIVILAKAWLMRVQPLF